MRIFILIFTLTANLIFAKENSLYVCAIFHNEARFLQEWIEFYLDQGADRIYLYNNRSADDYMKVLYPYIRAGRVSLRQWPYKHTNQQDWNQVQCRAYMHCVERTRNHARWVAFVDTDEFLFAPDGRKLVDALKDYEAYDGVCVNWVMYGSSGVQHIPEDERMVDHLLYRAELSYAGHHYIKTVVCPRSVERCDQPHNFVLKEGCIAVNENKIPVTGMFAPISVNKLRINHYWSRDRDFLLTEKFDRRKAWGNADLDMFLDEDLKRSQVYDPILASIRD